MRESAAAFGWSMDEPLLRYELGKRIGRGSYGACYAVIDARDSKLYCLKAIELNSSADKDLAEQEALLLSVFQHPHIVRYHDSFIHNDALCVVMDYCHGGDLSQHIRERSVARQPFSEGEVLDLFVQMLSAVEYVHSRRTIHRDLKTSNMLLTQHGEVRLADFGIAKVFEATHDGAATVIGSPNYMAPEICRGRTYSYPADIWSLGCILYELCALERAFQSTNLLACVYDICEGEVPLLPTGYSEELQSLVGSMLSKDPNGRPTIEEIRQYPLIRDAAQQLRHCELVTGCFRPEELRNDSKERGKGEERVGHDPESSSPLRKSLMGELLAASPSPAVASVAWYYQSADGLKEGPLEEVMLILMHALGDVHDDTPVWNAELDSWTPMSDVVQLSLWLWKEEGHTAVDNPGFVQTPLPRVCKPTGVE